MSNAAAGFTPTYSAWHDYPTTDTPITAAALGNYDSVLAALCARLNALTGQNAVFLDQYAGANDDAKLAAMFSDAKTNYTNYPLMLIGRPATFTAPIQRFSGCRLWGSPLELGIVDREVSTAYSPMPIQVNTGGSPWLTMPAGTTYNNDVGNMAVYSTDNATQIFDSQTNDYASVYRSMSVYGAKSVWGTASTKYLNTQINIVGRWVILGTPPGGMVARWGGSDSDLWQQGSLNCEGSTAGAGAYMFWLDSQQKTNVGPVYITAHNGWSAFKLTGSSGQSVRFWGARIEGRNATDPCLGSLVEMEGGCAQFYGCRFAFAMSSPNSNGRTTDNGVINQTAGTLIVQGGEYEMASGVTSSVPFVYSSGGSASVSNLGPTGTWSAGDKPGTKAAGGTVHNDWSVNTL